MDIHKSQINLSSSQTIVFGFHAVKSLLQQTPERVVKIYLQTGRKDQRIKDLLKLADHQEISSQSLSRKELDNLTQESNHQGVVAICNTVTSTKAFPSDVETLLEQLTESPFLLILDGVQDPHNLGACLRSANAAGVHAVIAPKDRAVGITSVVEKVASGAAELTPFIQVTNLARTLEMLKEQGVWLFGAAEEATDNIFQTDLTGPIAIVLGAEGTGLRRLTRDSCDKLIKIPTVGEIQSLNVSVAAGICLFEAVRQRQAKLL